MSYQKRKRKRRKLHKRKTQSSKPLVLCISGENIGIKAAQQIGLKLHQEILEKIREARLTTSSFADRDQLEYCLMLLPRLILVIWRQEDLTGLSKFYERLTEIKNRNPDYKPKLIHWEITQNTDKALPVNPKPVPTLLYHDAVIADFLVNRGDWDQIH